MGTAPPLRDCQLFMLCWAKLVAPMVEVASLIMNWLFYAFTDPQKYPGSFYDLELVRDVTIGILVLLALCLVADFFFCYSVCNISLGKVSKLGLWCWIVAHVICFILSSIHLIFVNSYVYNPNALSRYDIEADLEVIFKKSIRVDSGRSRLIYDNDKNANCTRTVTFGPVILCGNVLPGPYQSAGFLLWFGLLFLFIRLLNILFVVVALQSYFTSSGPHPQPSAAHPSLASESTAPGPWGQPNQTSQPQLWQVLPPQLAQFQMLNDQAQYWPPAPGSPPQYPAAQPPSTPRSASVDPPQPQQSIPVKSSQLPLYSSSYPPPPAEPAPQDRNSGASHSAKTLIASKSSFANALIDV